ncbi:unnamed protein product [Psylliodes chrysocephalus]|uniref:ATP-dependent DNA helicase n=1 Tax=Psylliodes chrysocephalus TaxID=3402493 RepID=A0A9P0D7Z2_9CUCU|nr:unnamed protein product [Psylliodes chrysocephala]
MPGWAVETNESKRIANDVILIIWDEAPMTPRFALEVVDRYLKDITNKNAPMGGECCVLGDYNMRARQHPKIIAELDNRTYSQWLLDLGNGTIPYTTSSAKAIIEGSRAPQDLIQIPRTFQLGNIDRLKNLFLTTMTSTGAMAIKLSYILRMRQWPM